MDKENKQNRVCKISSPFACIISGLKCLLSELAMDFTTNIVEDYGFNLEAKPFKPKSVAENTNPLDLSSFKSATAAPTEPVDPVQQ